MSSVACEPQTESFFVVIKELIKSRGGSLPQHLKFLNTLPMVGPHRMLCNSLSQEVTGLGDNFEALGLQLCV